MEKTNPARNLHLAGDFHIWWHQRVLCHLEQLAQNHHQALGTPQVHLLHAYDNAPVSARTARAHAALEETPAQPG